MQATVRTMQATVRASIARLAMAIAVASPILLGNTVARADEVAPDPRLEARERFGRGLRLFNEGDNAGALAEFERAYELAPHPVVLYNIGLVYAAMGRAVEATDTLDKVLKDPSALPPDKVGRARTVRDEQAARIAFISLTSSVEGAEIELDNVKVGRTPLSSPLRVTSGAHIVCLVAPGYIPARTSLTIAGGVKKTLDLVLAPTDRRVGHLSVQVRVPSAKVLVDGKPVGETPLGTPLALAAGDHSVEVSRPGYVTERRSVHVSERAQAALGLDLQIDERALPAQGGRLALDASEPDVSLSVDGRHLGKYAGSILLPAGRHVLSVRRDGFDPVEREVDVSRGATTTVRLGLTPTPEYRARYESKARAFRTWGWVGAVGGAAIAGAGTGYLIWNVGEKQKARDEFNAAADERDASNAGGGGAHCNSTVEPAKCDAWVDAYYDILQDKKRRDLYGWLGVGVGAAALGTGVVLLLSGGDPERYTPTRPELGGPAIVPTIWWSS